MNLYFSGTLVCNSGKKCNITDITTGRSFLIGKSLWPHGRKSVR